MGGTNEAHHSSTSGRRPTLAGNLCRSRLPVDFVTSFRAVLFQPNLISPLAGRAVSVVIVAVRYSTLAGIFATDIKGWAT